MDKPPLVRFSLATLLVVFAWVALLCVGLTAPSPLWSGLTALVVALAIMTAFVAAIYQTGHARAFGIGFAIFGVSSLLWLHRFEGYGPSSKSLAEDTFKVSHKRDWDSVVTRTRPPDAMQALLNRRKHFVETVQSAGLMAIAVLGGFIGRYLSIKREPKQLSTT